MVQFELIHTSSPLTSPSLGRQESYPRAMLLLTLLSQVFWLNKLTIKALTASLPVVMFFLKDMSYGPGKARIVESS